MSIATRESWLCERTSFIGASEVAAILGCGYADQSPITVWSNKVLGEHDESEEKRLRIGTLMEPVLMALFREETNLETWPCSYRVERHPDHPWLGATLDAFALERDGDLITSVPVELKNVGYFRKRDWEDEPPLQYLVQLQTQLAVTGAPHGYLFALIGGNETSCKRIERNDRFIAAMIEKLTEFWGYVERKELPPVDSSEATARALARIYPEDVGGTVELPEEFESIAADLASTKMFIKGAQATETEYENKLKAAIGDATFGVTPSGVRFSWKKTKDQDGYFVKPKQGYRVLRREKTKG